MSNESRADLYRMLKGQFSILVTDPSVRNRAAGRTGRRVRHYYSREQIVRTNENDTLTCRVEYRYRRRRAIACAVINLEAVTACVLPTTQFDGFDFWWSERPWVYSPLSSADDLMANVSRLREVCVRAGVFPPIARISGVHFDYNCGIDALGFFNEADATQSGMSHCNGKPI